MNIPYLQGKKLIANAAGVVAACHTCPCPICDNECWLDLTAPDGGDGTAGSPFNSILAVMTHIHTEQIGLCRCMIVHCVADDGIYTSEIINVANSLDYTGNNYGAYMNFVHEGSGLYSFHVDHLDSDLPAGSGALQWVWGVEKFNIYLNPTADYGCHSRIFRLIDCTYNIPAFKDNQQSGAVSFGTMVTGDWRYNICIGMVSLAKNLTLREDSSIQYYRLTIMATSVINCQIPATINSFALGASYLLNANGDIIPGQISDITINQAATSLLATSVLSATIISNVIINPPGVTNGNLDITCAQMNNVTITLFVNFNVGKFGPSSSLNYSKLYIADCNIIPTIRLHPNVSYWEIHLISNQMRALTNTTGSYKKIYVYPTMTHGVITNTGTGNEVIYV